jgi:hypothetical protein
MTRPQPKTWQPMLEQLEDRELLSASLPRSTLHRPEQSLALVVQHDHRHILQGPSARHSVSHRRHHKHPALHRKHIKVLPPADPPPVNLGASIVTPPANSTLPAVIPPAPTLDLGAAGFFGQDPKTGNWQASRFNGSSYVNEPLAAWNAVPLNWQHIVTGDFYGNGQTAIAGWDPATGNWNAITFDGTQYNKQVIGNWSPTGTYNDVTVGDINGDGRQDIIALDSFGNWLALTNTGQTIAGRVQFGNQTLSNWGTSNYQNVMIGDVNGDGRQDIVARDPTSGTWWSLQYNGSTYSTHSVGNWTKQGTWQNIQLADVNGDGRQDIVGQDATTGTWSAITYNGTSYVVQTLGTWDPTIRWQGVKIADLYGDHRQAIIGWDPTSGNWRAIHFDGTNYLNQTVGNWTPATYTDFLAGDITGDGRADIVARDNTGSWWALTYNGTAFGNQFLFGWDPTISWQNALLADTNGDGRQDIVARNPLTGDWQAIDFNGSTATSQVLGNWRTAYTYTDVRPADVNGDGRTDIIGRVTGTWNWIALQWNGTMFARQRLGNWDPLVQSWQHVFTANVNGADGPDLVGQDAATGDWWATTFSSATPVNRYLGTWDPAVPWQNVQVGDVFGDHRAAILGWNPITGNWLSIHFDGSKYVTQVLANWAPTTSYSDVQLADVNGDGRLDIVGRSGDGDWLAVTSNGTSFNTQFLARWDPTVNWQHILVGDVRGNGTQDLLGLDPATNTWWAVENVQGSFVTQPIGTWPTGISWQQEQLADVNGDGRLDIVGWDPGSGRWQDLQFDGSAFSTRALASWDPTVHWADVLVGDLNGDGQADFVGRDPTTGNWVGLLSSGTTYVTQIIASWGPNVAYAHVQLVVPQAGGPADLVGWDPSTGNWLAVGLRAPSNLLTNQSFVSQTLATWDTGVNWQNVFVGIVPGKSNATLRRLILDQVPGLGAALGTNPLEAVRMLQSWSANAAPFSLDSNLALLTEQAMSTASAAVTYYGVFLPNQGGVFCSGEATFFNQVLGLFGFTAFRVSFGDTVHDVEHTNTVVAIPNGSSWQYYVFDPTFDLQFRDLTGNYIPFFQALDDVSSGHTDQLSITEGSLAARNWIATQPIPNPEKYGHTPRGRAGAYYVYGRPQYSFPVYMGFNQAALQADGFSTTDMTTYLRLFALHVLDVQPPPSNPAVVQPFLAALKARGIPGPP